MWKALRPILNLVARVQGTEHNRSEQVRPRLLERPLREDVVHGFRLILGREPEDDNAIEAHLLISSVAELRKVLLESEEFQGKYTAMRPQTEDHPGLSLGREALFFIHLQKTGGTTLRAMLERQFPIERRCPVHDDRLHLLSVAELGRYDFFSGHFDRTAIRFVPRDAVKTVALFREPRARLISYYRFLRSHPTRDEFSNDQLIGLANEMTAEEFFEHPTTRSFAAVYNHYLVALGGSFSWFDQNRESLSKEDFSHALEEAKREIRALTALGITERFDESVKLIYRVLDLRPAISIEAIHVTDRFAELDARFRRVEPVTLTPRLADALRDLTIYDDELYRYAVGEFERRSGQFDGPQF